MSSFNAGNWLINEELKQMERYLDLLNLLLVKIKNSLKPQLKKLLNH
jgi:hypothetical protein